MKKVIIILFSVALLSPALLAQKNDCKKFHLYADCNVNPGPRFKYDGQSRSNIIGVGDQLIYSLVLYEEQQYKIIFCTSDFFKPIHMKVIDAVTDEVIYDNKTDDYLNTLTLNIDKTKRMKFFVEILAKDMSEEDKLEYFGCIGMMVQYKKIKQ
jgi:hypothetical protein